MPPDHTLRPDARDRVRAGTFSQFSCALHAASTPRRRALVRVAPFSRDAMKQSRVPLLMMWLLASTAHAQNTDDLAMAVASNHPAQVQAALDAGVDVNANLGEGRTPLITAVMMTKPDMVRFLLAHGADPNRQADDGAIGNALSAAFFASPGMAIVRRADEDFIAER